MIMKFEDLKENSCIKWQANRRFKAWNTFGKVIKLTSEEVTILTYDDLKETTLSKSGEAVHDEIDMITKDAFEDCLQRKLAELNVEKTDIEIDYKNNIKRIGLLINGANSALANKV